jgi:predicted Zn-dependent protease
MPTQYSRRAVLFGSLAALSGRLAIAAEPEIVIPPYNTITDEEEIELGNAFADELAKEFHLLDDSKIGGYSSTIVSRLAEHCRRKNMPYRVQVVDTKVVNACALPGGRIFLNRGLIEWSHNEGELVAVLAHEVGHVVGRHGANRLTRMAMARHLYDELKRSLGVNRNLVVKILEMMGGPMALLAQMKYSRDDETQADVLGAYNMQRAGWHPRHAAVVLGRFGEGESSAVGELTEVISTHPAPSRRSARIRSEMQQMPDQGETDVLGDFAQIQARCKALPPSPKPKQRG